MPITYNKECFNELMHHLLKQVNTLTCDRQKDRTDDREVIPICLPAYADDTKKPVFMVNFGAQRKFLTATVVAVCSSCLPIKLICLKLSLR